MKNIKEMQKAFKDNADNSHLKVECLMNGSFNSKIAIVYDAPTDRDASQGIPLTGGPGNIVWKALLKHAKIGRKDVYITQAIKKQVALTKAQMKKSGINRNEQGLWAQLLEWELGHLPNVEYIICLGNYALEALTGNTKINSWRGSVLDIEIDNYKGIVGKQKRNVKVMCMVNPAAVFRDPKLEVTFNMDAGTVGRLLRGEHSPTEVVTTMYPEIAVIDNWIDNAIPYTGRIAGDIETIGGETACIGFADTETTAICIALRTKTENVYTVAEEAHIRRRIQELYYSPNPQFVAQNGMFDMTWQGFKDKIIWPKIHFDTMLAHHTLYPQLPHNLGFLTTQYTDNPYYKEDINNWRDGDDIQTFWDYNGKDCAYLLAIARREEAELRNQGLWDFFINHVMRIQPHLSEATIGGILVDMQRKASLHDELDARITVLVDQFRKLCEEATGEYQQINLSSPKQLSQLYFTDLKLVGRGTSTNKENRDRMYKHPRTSELSRKILSTHDEWAKEHKFFTTYVKMMPDEDDRIRCSWNQTGVQSAPGRLSSSQTLWGSGGNLQNQPERAYPMFIADKGYGFAYYDLSQVEARVVAWEAGIDTWKHQFEQARLDGKYDAHRALAADMFKVPYDEVPTFDRYDSANGYMPPEGKVDGDVTIRFISKRCRHGLNYKMMPDRLAITTGLSLVEADRAYRIYHRETPELRVWWHTLEQELKTKGALYNAYGRRYIVMERLSPEALEAIVAFKPQSTNGDKNARVMALCHEDERWPSHCRIRINVHDALICLGRLDQLELALSIMKGYAEEPIIIHGEELIVPADTKLSYADEEGVHRWSQLKSHPIQAATITPFL